MINKNQHRKLFPVLIWVLAAIFGRLLLSFLLCGLADGLHDQIRELFPLFGEEMERDVG